MHVYTDAKRYHLILSIMNLFFVIERRVPFSSAFFIIFVTMLFFVIYYL